MRRKEIDIARLAALSDGVFAVAMTLLVVALPLPRNAADLQGRPLSEHLLTLLPQFRAVVISFVVAAAFWRAHHDFFRALVRADRTVAWLNFLLLFATRSSSTRQSIARASVARSGPRHGFLWSFSRRSRCRGWRPISRFGRGCCWCRSR
jgi:hypothetical protein